MSSVSPARRAAFRILKAVELGQAHSDDLLRDSSVDRLSGPDRHLTTALVLGVLRWQIRLDDVVRGYLSKPNTRLDTEVRIALRMGAYQLLYLDRIPAHAAIDESVELTRQAGHRFASGMVNAVLRKMSVAPKPAEPVRGLPVDEAANAWAHPKWLVERWSSQFGTERACAICRYDQQAPELAVHLRGAEVERELLDAGIRLRPSAMLAAARFVETGDITGMDAFRQGRVRIQDEGSQFVAEFAAAAALPSLPRTILDACAAPGGKTLILAERHPGSSIVAYEISKPRFEQMRARFAEANARVECRHADVTALEDDGAYDLVLADVPCSGTGTLGRNPEIRHRLTADELSRQAERQRAILHAALRAVRPGGAVVYSTCSLEPEEDEQVVEAVLSETGNARVITPSATLADMESRGVLLAGAAARLQSAITPNGYLRLFPDICGTDGFFIAMLQRNS